MAETKGRGRRRGKVGLDRLVIVTLSAFCWNLHMNSCRTSCQWEFNLIAPEICFHLEHSQLYLKFSFDFYLIFKYSPGGADRVLAISETLRNAFRYDLQLAKFTNPSTKPDRKPNPIKRG